MALVHYLYLTQHGVIYLMFVYGKDERTTLTVADKKQLRAAVEAIKSEWDDRG